MKLSKIERAKRWWAKRSSQTYIDYIRSKGVQIGDHCRIVNPRLFDIDLQRAHLITIGNNVTFNQYNCVVCHDGVAQLFREKFHDYLPSNGHITIGNNVQFGQHATVLKGVTIGDNCFIGFGATVTRDIPANSIAVGTPAKVICTLDEYYERRKTEALQESFEYARGIRDRYHRRPVPEDFTESFVWFVNGKDIDKYPNLPIKYQLGAAYDNYRANHVAKFASFDEFLKAAGIG